MVQNMVLPNTWNACPGMFYIVIYCITFLAKLTLSVTQKQHSLPTRCRSRSLWCRNQVVRKGTNLSYHVTVSLNITGFFVCLLACLSVSIFFFMCQMWSRLNYVQAKSQCLSETSSFLWTLAQSISASLLLNGQRSVICTQGKVNTLHTGQTTWLSQVWQVLYWDFSMAPIALLSASS